MQPAGRRPVVDVALQGGTMSVAEQVDRAKVLRRLRLGDVGVPPPDARRRRHRSCHPRRHHRFAGLRLVAGAAHLRLQLPLRRGLESGHREIRRDRADLRHRRHLAHRHADRGAGRPDHRAVPHRTVPDVAAPADRHRHRAARRHSQHHLRHLGPVRVRAVPAAIRAAVPDRRVRQCAGAFDAVRRPALRHRHADRRPDPRHHGAAVHHLDLARRVRSGAAGAQGGGLWPRLHHLGGGALRGAALHPRRRDRRRHARAWAARSARPWR